MMKRTSKHQKQHRESVILRKGGKVVLPPLFSTFSLGQRVYFHIGKEGVTFRAQPKRSYRGRLLSSRVRRGIRSLALYGPRAKRGLSATGC